MGEGNYFLLTVGYLFFQLWLNIRNIKLATITTFNYTISDIKYIRTVVEPSPPSISSTSSSSPNESPYP